MADQTRRSDLAARLSNHRDATDQISHHPRSGREAPDTFFPLLSFVYILCSIDSAGKKVIRSFLSDMNHRLKVSQTINRKQRNM